MMKKQIFILMLSAIIFTTAPLFAMEDDGEKQIIRHSCPACNKESRYKEVNNYTPHLLSKAAITGLEKDALIEVIKKLPYEALLNFSASSKMLYNLCHLPTIWENLLRKREFEFSTNSKLCKKFIFQNKRQAVIRAWLHQFRLAR